MVQVADSISYQAFVIPNIGNEQKIVGAAFNKQLQGKVSAVIAGNAAVFVIRGENIFANASLNDSPAMVREQLESHIKQQVGSSSINTLRQAADVKDYRSSFY